MNDTRNSKNLKPGRRDFIKKLGKVTLAAAAAPLVATFSPVLARGRNEPAEQMVLELLESLTGRQKRSLLLSWDDPRRLQARNNWHVVRKRISGIYTRSQQEIIREILRGALSEVGFEKTMRAMQDDGGGLGNYSAALFSDVRDRLCFLLAGRHQTIRVDGGNERNAVFGGPMFYGHAVDFNERPDHPGNVWWHQSRLAGKVYDALDGKQQNLALVRAGSPADAPSSVVLRGNQGRFSGLPVSELSADQKGLVEQTLRSLLEPYRESDVAEVLASIKSNGGLGKLHMSFYEEGDLPDQNGIWDRWKLEGPAFAWYFRGSPHVHTWVNVAHKGVVALSNGRPG